MFNPRYTPIEVILKQTTIGVSHSNLLLVILKQAAVIVSHSHLLLFFGVHGLTLFASAFCT